VTTLRYVTGHTGQLSLAIPLWISGMCTGWSLGKRNRDQCFPVGPVDQKKNITYHRLGQVDCWSGPCESQQSIAGMAPATASKVLIIDYIVTSWPLAKFFRTLHPLHSKDNTALLVA